MKKVFLLVVAGAIAGPAFAQHVARCVIEVSSFDIPLIEIRPDVWGITSPYTIQSGEGIVTVQELEMDRDPFITYGLAVTDFGAPSSFLFLFSTPIVTVTGPNSVSGSIVGGLTDATGDGVALTPTPFAKAQSSSVGAPTTNMGVDVGDAVSFGPGNPGANYTYGSYALGPQAGPVGTWTTLQVQTGFSLSGQGDVAALTGFTSIDPVPEPVSMAALGIGLLGLIARRRLKS